MRRSHPAFGRGTLEFLEPGNRQVLAYLREHEGITVLCVASWGAIQDVELDLSRWTAGCRWNRGPCPFPPIGQLPTC